MRQRPRGTEKKRSRMSRRRSSQWRRRSPGLAARGCAAELHELAEEVGWRSCQTWKRKRTRKMEERVADAGPERAKDSVLVRAVGPEPEAGTGAGSVEAWKTPNLN